MLLTVSLKNDIIDFIISKHVTTMYSKLNGVFSAIKIKCKHLRIVILHRLILASVLNLNACFSCTSPPLMTYADSIQTPVFLPLQLPRSLQTHWLFHILFLSALNMKYSAELHK